LSPAVFQVIPRLLLLLCLPGLLLMMPIAAAGKSPMALGAAPPEPVELHLKVHREGKTEIPLRIYGKAGEVLKYAIRVPPEHGKLSEPQATKDREVSVVVYEPPADLSVTSDKFYYTVQSALGVSGAVLVSITILDDPPKLAISDSLDFGKIRAGATTSRMLQISNKGGMIANGKVVVDSPWRIEGKADYHLAADEIAVFKIFFEPTEGREYEGVARYTSEPEHSTTLRGVAIAAIATDPAEWVLQPTPGETERSGTFDLYNQLDEARTLKLTTDGQLKIPAEISLAAHGKAKVTVEAAADNPQAWETEIRLTGKDFSVGVPVRVPALGPVVRLTTPAIAFGRIISGKDAESNFGLENVGGTLGTVYWEVSPPFKSTQTATPLRPGESKTFALKIDTKEPGHYRAWVHFTSGVQSFDLPVQAEVAAAAQKSGSAPATSAPAPAPAPTATGQPGSSDPTAAAGNPATGTHPPFPADWLEPLPHDGVQVHSITPTTGVIEWPGSLSKATNFRAEMIQFSLGRDHLMHATWLWDNEDPIERRGENYALILKALTPNQPYTVRILPLDASGHPGERLFAISFSTPAKARPGSWLPSISILQGLLAVLAVLLGWHLWNWWRGRGVARA
jgi:hypothetical protein